MIITIKYSVRELVGDLRDGLYTLPEGATVYELLKASEQEANKTLNEEVRKSIIFLVNSKPATWETILKDGDDIRVLYKIIGG